MNEEHRVASGPYLFDREQERPVVVQQDPSVCGPVPALDAIVDPPFQGPNREIQPERWNGPDLEGDQAIGRME